ncbi:MAG: 4a-hydroxytetrahydrobiopterin dehydratase [Dehalococcoidia bacterium]|nr:4a-hydroxytetrahydrobiopterin dehydratase [Dehalococcoidia bacterium]
MTTKLSTEETRNRMASINGWQHWGSAIARSYTFGTFTKAMDFVNKVARLAEEVGHHPDISISYTRVTLTLSTHVVSGLSEKDFDLAAKIDAIADPSDAKHEAKREKAESRAEASLEAKKD